MTDPEEDKPERRKPECRFILLAYGPDPGQAKAFIEQVAAGPSQELLEDEYALGAVSADSNFIWQRQKRFAKDTVKAADLVNVANERMPNFTAGQAQYHTWAERDDKGLVDRTVSMMEYAIGIDVEDERYLPTGSGGPVHDLELVDGQVGTTEYFGVRGRVRFGPPLAWIARLHEQNTRLHVLLFQTLSDDKHAALYRFEVLPHDSYKDQDGNPMPVSQVAQMSYLQDGQMPMDGLIDLIRPSG